PICKIVENSEEKIFYTLTSAVRYVENELAVSTATIEMLMDYTVPAADVPEIPKGVNIKLTTATDGIHKYSGSGSDIATILRSTAATKKPILINNGNLTLEGITIDGASVEASAPIILSTGTLEVGNTATIQNAKNSSNGGAILATAGDITIANEGSISENSAASGGAIYYTGGGTIRISGSGTITNNKASGGNGGGIYATGGSILVTGSSQFTGNKAEQGCGGAIYAAGALVEMDQSSHFEGNSAQKGGAIYTDNATLRLSAGSIKANTAQNGAAIFVNSGNASFSGGSCTRNSAAAGGAIGVGSASARLTFSKDIQIKDNELKAGENTQKCNIYLDLDSDDVLSMAGLGSDASIGIYVAKTLTTTRDAPGKRFASYTDDTNIDKITNDQYDFSIQKDTVTKKLFWGKGIPSVVRYVASFSSDFPPVNQGEEKYNKEYFPTFNNGAMSELATELLTQESLGLKATAIYGGAFASDAAGFEDYVTHLAWNTNKARWDLTKRNGTTEALGSRGLILYYAEPAYVSIENNTDRKLHISDLKILGRSAINSAAQAGYGMVFARNGSIRTSLLPVTAEDLQLGAGSSINLLFPGGQNTDYTLDGSFEGGAGSIRLRQTMRTGGLDPTEISLDDNGKFASLTGKTLNSGGTYRIIFGDDQMICKIKNGDTEYPFSSIKNAVDYARTNNLTTAVIEMLTDYLKPKADDVKIPQGYAITLTTAAKKDEDDSVTYPYRGEGTRATISRDSDNTDAMITTATGDEASALTLQNLIFDGKSVRGTSDGGAVEATFFKVRADHVDFFNIYANKGGALFVDDASNGAKGKANSIVEAENCLFSRCNATLLDGNRLGGGAIHAFSDSLTLKKCIFEYCDGGDQAGAVFHRVDGNNESWTTIEECRFSNCTAKAAGGLELDSKYITVKNSTFTHCTATHRNGGGFNVYALNAKEPAAATECTVDVEGCTFSDCHADSTTQDNYGGGFRSNAILTTVKDCTFDNCSSRYGGGVGISNKNATDALIEGCTIQNCSSSTEMGGGVYIFARSSTIRGCKIEDNRSAKSGGGIFVASDGADRHLIIEDSRIKNNTASIQGGGVYTNSALTLRNDVVISGNRLSTNTVEDAAGVYLINERTLTIGTENASQLDKTSIQDNVTASGASSNVRLWETSGKNNEKSVSVLCGLNGHIGVINAKIQGTQFGSSTV
ncbi:MAG: right-handed parallel beta-helix repeat-containing protein, partial [Lachnospiraceae bacterium]|nr:right-handed parallel beta-helix repeat-containing protein [Lachnospiraceae bacterium]